MKNKKLAALAAVPILAAGLTAATAFAASGSGAVFFKGVGMHIGMNASPEEMATAQTGIFTSEASILGVSEDEVKNAWAEGKDLRTLAEEKGISEESIRAKMKELRSAEIDARLKTLVEKGVITQAQADKRLAFEKKMLEEGPGKGMRAGRHGGFGGPGMGMMGR